MRVLPLLFLILLCLSHTGWARTVDAPLRHSQPMSLTIMADSSLTVPLNLIARAYALQHDVSISTVFSPTKEQIEQIRAGEDANILITARSAWMDEAQQKGLIDIYSRIHLARNRLVMVAPLDTPRVLPSSATVEQLSRYVEDRTDAILALGNASTSAEGHYALQSLRYYGWDRVLEPHYHFLRNIPQITSMITGYDALGIMFRSDVPLHPNLKEIFRFSENSHRPILYEGAVVAGDDMEEARIFLSYLQSRQARRIFARFGLEPV